ncbi:MAG TPA: hypothetical protein VJA82_03985 [Sediminibacterium sp.]|uniref:hypothetical protein n=1 Tax=Sediminibacterium sp. TaxID=1917865 RepID=UPI0008B8CEE5|nr:hypothetical protein [Sediminibacterium sp.]OHC85894.1 MAG: hypothetical protein A2472_09205 [Sphingobacteriia bacterium RIFOXYC2_FULL_35_18]OHC87429.1 MAG: hypothetical protein A2546_05360 [Sphingobacteriia bacterium RIFOXYD2_FULL_35_12]HLD52439.1 hypothetical protein [Sediminibacterium sp.]
MNLFRNIVFLICLISCSDKIKQSETININETLSDSFTKEYKSIDTVRVIDLEYLDWNSLKINNKLPLLTSKRELINLFGSIDSIVSPNYDEICVSYFDSGYKFLYLGLSVFEIKDTMSVISSIDFESGNIRIFSPKIIFEKSTTFEEIKKLFPNSAKEATQVVIENNRTVLSLKLATSKFESDNAWILLFEGEKLIKFEYWMPC